MRLQSASLEVPGHASTLLGFVLLTFLRPAHGKTLAY